MEIIDAHLHFRPEMESFCEMSKQAGHQNTWKHLESVWNQNNIVHGVVMGNMGLEMDLHQYPEKMSYCIGIDGRCFKGDGKASYFIELAQQHLKQEACVGIKLYPGYCPNYIYEKEYFPYYELAQTYQKVVAVHTGQTSRADAYLKYSHPLVLDKVAAMFPQIQFVMCHFGSPWMTDATAVLSKNKNVSADLSGILEGNPHIEEFKKENDSFIQYIKMWLSYVNDYDRFLFGTDWPLVNIDAYIQFISCLIPEKHYEKVFCENAKRVYQLI